VPGQFAREDKGGEGSVVLLLQETFAHPAILSDGALELFVQFKVWE
jgi:hypothetical protein